MEVECEPSHQDGRASGVERTETPDAVAILPADSEPTLPVAKETGIQMTTVVATLAMPPASHGDMDALPAAVLL